MIALPPKANLTGANVTQGQFKTALDTVNDYLTGLLGSDGTPATARAALGVINATAPTSAQVIAALGFTPFSATSGAGKVDKSGDTMTGALSVQASLTVGNGASADVYLTDDESTSGPKRIHANSNLVGLLNGAGSWLEYTNNAGQVWTANYGWLHDRFQNTGTLSKAGVAWGRYAGSTGNCGNISNGIVSYLNITNSGGFDLYHAYSNCTNCNCDCNCACACCG